MPRRGLAGEPELACRVLECPHPVAACAGQYSWTAHERMPRTSLNTICRQGYPARRMKVIQPALMAWKAKELLSICFKVKAESS